MDDVSGIEQALSDVGVEVYPAGSVPDDAVMPYIDYGLKLSTSDRAGDSAYARHLRYDVRLYQERRDDEQILAVLDALEAAGMPAEIYTYDEPDEGDVYTVYETTIERR